MSAQHNAPTPHPGGTEEDNVDIGAVVRFGVGLAAGAVAVFLVIWALFGYFSAREAQKVTPEYPLAAGQQQLPPEPRLQAHPRDDLRDLRAREEAALQSYGWVDRNAGTVRIPITEAMKLTLQRGLPSRPAGQSPSAAASPGDRSAGKAIGETGK